jgi:outer membrane protein, heavy metal efflux system
MIHRPLRFSLRLDRPSIQKILSATRCLCLIVGLALVAGPVWAQPNLSNDFPANVDLSLEQALQLFLTQNLDLLIAKYGIEEAKAQIITARLFPNPVLSFNGGSAFTQGQTFSGTRFLSTGLQQLFLLAGKRGYRMESAGFGIHAAEANFEDAIRQLTLTVKDTYFRVQLATRRLELAKENQERFGRILAISDIRLKKGYIAEIDLIRIRLQKVDFDTQVIQFIQESELAKTDLRLLLGLSPSTNVRLTSELVYRRVEPNIAQLRAKGLEERPDLKAKRFALNQQLAEFKLAKAFRYPDPSVGGNFTVQGPQGGSNQQLYGFNLEVPLPLFDRNQGGIVQAEVGVQVSEADVRRTEIQVKNEIDVAYRNLLQARQLIEAYQAGILEDARATFSIVEQAYQKGGVTLLDLLDAARTSGTIQQNYLEALFQYQQNLFLLERATGQEVSS